MVLISKKKSMNRFKINLQKHKWKFIFCLVHSWRDLRLTCWRLHIWYRVLQKDHLHIKTYYYVSRFDFPGFRSLQTNQKSFIQKTSDLKNNSKTHSGKIRLFGRYSTISAEFQCYRWNLFLFCIVQMLAFKLV